MFNIQKSTKIYTSVVCIQTEYICVISRHQIINKTVWSSTTKQKVHVRLSYIGREHKLRWHLLNRKYTFKSYKLDVRMLSPNNVLQSEQQQQQQQQSIKKKKKDKERI